MPRDSILIFSDINRCDYNKRTKCRSRDAYESEMRRCASSLSLQFANSIISCTT